MVAQALVLGLRLAAALAAAPVAAPPAPSPSAAQALSPTADLYEGATVKVKARALPPQISERAISGDEARQVPGAGGDVIRAVASLPGSLTANDYLSNLLVRGSGFNDNLILLDGLPVAYPFHFGGLESVFHPALIDQALFLPGGFDARFGDTLGGVLDLRSKDPEPGLHGEAGFSLIQAGALLSLAQAAGADGWSVEGAWRSGTLQWVLGGNPAFAGLPAWADWHAQIRGPAWGGTLRLVGQGATDSLVAQGGPDASTSRWDNGFASAGATWQGRLGAWSLDLRAWGGADRQSADLGPQLNLIESPSTLGGLVELDRRLSGQHDLDLGAQWQGTWTRMQGVFNRVPLELGSTLASEFNPATAGPVDDEGRKGLSSAWIQDRWQTLPGAAMTLGGRYDQVDSAGGSHFSPRWGLSVDAWAGGAIKASVGDDFQSPDPLQTVAGWGGAGLGSSLVRSYSLGVEQRLGGWDLTVEAYHKGFQQFVGLSGTSNTFAEDGGWAEGAEALLRLPPRGPVQGWFSYAWSDVMRATPTTSTAGPTYYPGDFSQPQALGMVLQARLPWGLQLGARLRVASGIPYTPVASRVSSTAGSVVTWTPTFGGTNSARLEPYQRLDLRLQKRWQPAARAWWRSVTGYVELINLTDAPNVTTVTYEDDYSDIRRIRQFPRLAFAGADLAF
jgi:hypothetical protein